MNTSIYIDARLRQYAATLAGEQLAQMQILIRSLEGTQPTYTSDTLMDLCQISMLSVKLAMPRLEGISDDFSTLKLLVFMHDGGAQYFLDGFDITAQLYERGAPVAYDGEFYKHLFGFLAKNFFWGYRFASAGEPLPVPHFGVDSLISIETGDMFDYTIRRKKGGGFDFVRESVDTQNTLHLTVLASFAEDPRLDCTFDHISSLYQ